MAGFTYRVFPFTTTFTSTVPGTDDMISAVDWANFTINSGNDTITTFERHLLGTYDCFGTNVVCRRKR